MVLLLVDVSDPAEKLYVSESTTLIVYPEAADKFDEEKPLSLILTASASSFDVEEVLKLMSESVNFPYRANVDAWAITVSGNSEKFERRLIYPNQWYV